MTTTAATVTTPAGETWELGELATTWKFASFYTSTDSDSFLIKYHRSETAAAKGQWDSAEMRKVYAHAGYAPIAR